MENDGVHADNAKDFALAVVQNSRNGLQSGLERLLRSPDLYRGPWWIYDDCDK